jgi:hypothetical protein
MVFPGIRVAQMVSFTKNFAWKGLKESRFETLYFHCPHSLQKSSEYSIVSTQHHTDKGL